MRIAVIDDDKATASQLVGALLGDGHNCHAFDEASSFLRVLPWEGFDACVVEHHLPAIDGKRLLGELRDRKQSLPVLILTPRDAEIEITNAFNNSNSDFLVKPVNLCELRARLKALMGRGAPAATTDMMFEYDRFQFNLKTLEVKDASVPVLMTQKEFQLALLLMGNIGKALSRGDIREAVWGRNIDIPSRTLDTHVSRVRSKLRLRPVGGYLLAPLYSYGYRLENLKLH
jgi:DNA-binding response OmpR family regulator